MGSARAGSTPLIPEIAGESGFPYTLRPIDTRLSLDYERRKAVHSYGRAIGKRMGQKNMPNLKFDKEITALLDKPYEKLDKQFSFEKVKSSE
jgi:hypothetical protein